MSIVSWARDGMFNAAFTFRVLHAGQRASLGVVSVPPSIDLGVGGGRPTATMRENHESSQGPRDNIQPEDDLNMFLGCSVGDWDLGFVVLAAATITNFQNFWKLFQPSRKARLWYYNLSAE